MMHPSSVIRFVSQTAGYGVFATEFIPLGTIIFVQDLLDLELSIEHSHSLPATYQEVVKRYSYINSKGKYVLCWDQGKYVNHCCQPNTMTTGYDFEIAIQDIYPGDEITDDYGLFNLEEELQLVCSKKHCRGAIRQNDWMGLLDEWDQKVRHALSYVKQVEQPLEDFIEREVYEKLLDYLSTGEGYQSVVTQKYEHRPMK